MSDIFQVFCWQWLNNSWIYRGDLSEPLQSDNYQDAQKLELELETNLPKFENGWFYVGVYYWDGNHWEFQDGKLVWTQQLVGGMSQSASMLPPSTSTINPNTDENITKTGMSNPTVKETNGDNTTKQQESDTMTWLVPVLAGLVGAAAVGGAIWYSMKKEEQYGLIGSPRVKQVAEPTKNLYVWQVSLQVISPLRPNLRHQLQYTIQANNEQEAIEKAEKISRNDGNKVVDVVSVVRGHVISAVRSRTVQKSTIAEPAIKMPKEVKQVVIRMQINAVQANQLEDSVYAARNIEHGEEVWVIGDNYERISLNLVYKNDIWYYRDSYSEGPDRLMKNGLKEALANADIFYTG